MWILLLLIAVCLKIGFRWHQRTQQMKKICTSNKLAVFISGCDSGIGLELAKRVYETTNYTVICGFLSMPTSEGYHQLKELTTHEESSRLILYKLDITSTSDIEEIKRKIGELIQSERITNLVALVNNAGILTYGEFDWLTWDQISSQIEVNLVGSIRLTRALVPFIIDAKGRIINISSVNDLTVFPGLSIYSATKSALSTFSRGLGYELRKFGVKVITLRLGDFARLTNIMATHETKRDEMWKRMGKDKREIYGDFFHHFNKHLMTNYGMTSPRAFCDSNLFHDFQTALLKPSPPSTITCAPVTFRLFYFTMEMLPISMQYNLLDLMLRFGFKWKPSRTIDR